MEDAKVGQPLAAGGALVPRDMADSRKTCALPGAPGLSWRSDRSRHVTENGGELGIRRKQGSEG
jgi:hypothetical protein